MRLVYLDMTEQIGRHWLAAFDGDPRFRSAAYWDLLMALWAAQRPLRKTEALQTMRAIRSTHTAGKILDTMLAERLVIERENPDDARSRLIDLEPSIRQRLEKFLDCALEEVLATAKRLRDGPQAQ